MAEPFQSQVHPPVFPEPPPGQESPLLELLLAPFGSVQKSDVEKLPFKPARLVLMESIVKPGGAPGGFPV